MMPEEMTKLRKTLDERKIAWVDKSDDMGRSFPFLDMMIYRTWFYYGGLQWSVISGFSTYGGDKGLLELWTSNSKTVGSLTAKDILTMMGTGGD